MKYLWRFKCSWRSQRRIHCACVLLGGHYPAPRLDSMALRWEKFCYETDLSHYTGTTTVHSSVAKDLKTRQYSAVVYKRSAYMQIKTLQYPHSLAFSSAGNSTEDRRALPASLLLWSSPSWSKTTSLEISSTMFRIENQVPGCTLQQMWYCADFGDLY